MEKISYQKAIEKLKSYKISISPFYKVTDGWKLIFNERNKLNSENMKFFLNRKSGVSIGIGMSLNSQLKEIKSFEKHKKITFRKNPHFIETLNLVSSENIFGEEPIKVNSKKITLSNLINAGTYHELRKVTGRFNSLTIRVLEIGSGYGELARQIIKYSTFYVSDYHCIDLPENLIFSELYLGTIFGSQSVKNPKFFLSSDFNEQSEMHINFSFFDPSELSQLLDSYDLIINTYSMQEMHLDTVQAYIQLVKAKLKRNGVFFSINSPKKWEVKTYSDYNFSGLQNIFSHMHRQLPPAGAHATVPIVNVFVPSENKSAHVDESIINVIGELQILGFGNFLNQKYCKGKLSITSPNALLVNLLNEVISPQDNLTETKRSNVSEVLSRCIAKKNILNHQLEEFLLEADKSLSDKSILVLANLSSHHKLDKMILEINNYYKISLYSVVRLLIVVKLIPYIKKFLFK